VTTSHLTEDTLTLDALKAGESAERPGGGLLQLGAGGGHQARVAGFRHPVRAFTPKKMFLNYKGLAALRHSSCMFIFLFIIHTFIQKHS
jgi:hypothetical protein